LPKKLPTKRTTVLVQVEDPTFDLSGKRILVSMISVTFVSSLTGDIGAIGRLVALPNDSLILDLKGHQYAGTIVPCNTFAVVGMSGVEARVST
jgi:hypothetical protein